MEPTMTPNRYFIARFIENIARGESKNIGVFYLSEQGLSARFLGERPNGSLDLRSARSVTPHNPTYKQWIEYWRRVLKEFTDPKEAIEEIKASAKGNFVIDEGSRLFVPPGAMEDESQTLEYLFHLLVGEFPSINSVDAVQLSLAKRCEEIIKRFRLRKDPHFHESPSIAITVDGGLTHVRPSYQWLNGRSIFYQKALLDESRFDISQRDVTSTRWLFEQLKLTATNVETKALVRFADDEGNTTAISRQEQINLLEPVADKIINVDDERAVEEEFSSLIPA